MPYPGHMPCTPLSHPLITFPEPSMNLNGGRPSLNEVSKIRPSLSIPYSYIAIENNIIIT